MNFNVVARDLRDISIVLMPFCPCKPFDYEYFVQKVSITSAGLLPHARQKRLSELGQSKRWSNKVRTGLRCLRVHTGFVWSMRVPPFCLNAIQPVSPLSKVLLCNLSIRQKLLPRRQWSREAPPIWMNLTSTGYIEKAEHI